MEEGVQVRIGKAMIKGYSGAVLTVVKRGPYVREQGELINRLGPNVAPKIITLLPDGYEMEMLQPVSGDTFTIPRLAHVLSILRNEVWKPLRDEHVEDWIRPFNAWSDKGEYDFKGLREQVYSRPIWDDIPMLIHGDPTLANLMLRDVYTLVITDPMPRTNNRLEIPNCIHVDIGKLMQSAYGWEAFQGEGNLEEAHGELLPFINEVHWSRSFFWAAVHLERLSRRALMKRDHKTHVWASRGRDVMVQECKNYLY